MGAWISATALVRVNRGSAKEDDKAIAIPDRQTKVKPAKEKAVTTVPGRELPKQKPAIVTPTHEQPHEMAKVNNTVPFGAGGPVAGPYTTFQSGSTPEA